ncbi:Cell wall beta-glucan synthesis [Penicillium bovifimosum]|uniref:Cell wall beta-glucan synthesis n=1 Tax=Penicillium bovifimosum TaxID=126998 RepID=A0A9W9KSF1_9EURO|nr:Cell wall beta-glucan synthesis [Penicillium bovifimosum]KAJ5118166.1 Cell wall beta-glucan synthesis [Penicillium bovifimosum]
MRLSVTLILLPLAISVGGLMITEPENGNAIDVSVPFTVKWSSVETDPKTFDIVIVNNNAHPRVEERVASGIDTTKGSYTVPGLKDIDHGIGYQVNLVSNTVPNTGILAQSPQFEVVPPAKGLSNASTTEGASTTNEASTADGLSTLTVSIISATSTGTSATATSQTDVSTKTELTITGTLTFSVPTTAVSTGESTIGTHTTGGNNTIVSSTTATELITTTRITTNTVKTSSDSDLATSTSYATDSAGSTTTTVALPTHSKGSAMALAAPGVVAGLLAGVLGFNL